MKHQNTEVDEMTAQVTDASGRTTLKAGGKDFLENVVLTNRCIYFVRKAPAKH